MDWKKIAEKFNWEPTYAGKVRQITSTRMTRTGLELSGFLNRKEIKATILWGKEEFDYLSSFNLKTSKAKVENIFKCNPPLVVFSRTFESKDWIIELAKKYDITLIHTKISSSEINTIVNVFLSEELAKTITIHGNLLEIYGKGVLLIAESGMGKSETTIELIKKGHFFVADDAIDCKKVFGKLMGCPSKLSKGFMEARGLGIINVARLFGIEKVIPSCEINVVIELVQYNPQIHEYERLGRKIKYKSINGVDIPYYLVPISPGRKISDMIEVTVSNLKLIESGYNSFNEFIKISKGE